MRQRKVTMTFIDPERARAKYGECDDDFECEACGSDIDVCQSPWGQLCVDCRDHEHCREVREVRDERENQEE